MMDDGWKDGLLPRSFSGHAMEAYTWSVLPAAGAAVRPHHHGRCDHQRRGNQRQGVPCFLWNHPGPHPRRRGVTPSPPLPPPSLALWWASARLCAGGPHLMPASHVTTQKIASQLEISHIGVEFREQKSCSLPFDSLGPGQAFLAWCGYHFSLSVSSLLLLICQSDLQIRCQRTRGLLNSTAF